ncbi:TPA: hypothetical protein GXZ34_02310 [bacterium]|nr:hypothetical protein [bacterium]
MSKRQTTSSRSILITMDRRAINRLLLLSMFFIFILLSTLMYLFTFSVGLKEIEGIIYLQFIISVSAALFILPIGKHMLGRENRVVAYLVSSITLTIGQIITYISAKLKYLNIFNPNILGEALIADVINYLLIAMFSIVLIYTVLSLINLIIYLIYDKKNEKLLNTIKQNKVEKKTTKKIEKNKFKLEVESNDLLKLNAKKTPKISNKEN